MPIEELPAALVVGGSSGLGLELARQLQSTHDVIVTWSSERPNLPDFTVRQLSLNLHHTTFRVDELLKVLPPIDILVYAAGFYQVGHLAELTQTQIGDMIDVGLHGPAFLLHRLLQHQEYLSILVMVTSTSQWTARELEPVYTAVKAGSGMLAKSLSLDPNIGKVLVVAPGGMKSGFYRGTDRDLSGMLDPAWVAAQTMPHLRDDYQYRLVAMLREPPRVEVRETIERPKT